MFYFYVFEFLFAGFFDLRQRNRKDKYFDKTTPTPWLTQIRFTRILLTRLLKKIPIPHLTRPMK